MNEFQIGDTVELHIGGNPMQVRGVDGAMVLCSWTYGEALRIEEFQSGELRKVGE